MTVARLRSDSARTREQLLDAAERLFAEHGIGAVSLRMINAESGARNVSAAHYHFGSKDGVVAALVTRRMSALAAERMAGLDAVERLAGPGVPDLRAALEIVVEPLLRMLTDPAGANFVTFLARAAGDPAIAMNRLAPPEFWQVMGRLLGLLRRALPDLPNRVLAVRLGFVIQQTVITVAEIDRLMRRDGRSSDWTALASVGDDLVDYFVGGLSAPVRAAERDAPRRATAVSRGDAATIADRVEVALAALPPQRSGASREDGEVTEGGAEPRRAPRRRA